MMLARSRSAYYFQPNQYNAYSVNSITAKNGSNGSIAIQFGGRDGKIQNCLPIAQGWNYTLRLFRPRSEISITHGISAGAACELSPAAGGTADNNSDESAVHISAVRPP
jgi:hypothetical protein